MKRLALVVICGCGSAPAPVATVPVSTTQVAPPVAVLVVAEPSEAVPTPPSFDKVPPDHVAKLPKVDFAPAYVETSDPVAAAAAAKLHAEGVAAQATQDLATAEQKYLEALRRDAGHVRARYDLASVYNLTNRSERGLALLAELEKASCEACSDLLGRAKYDDAWRMQWDREVFWQLTLEIRPAVAERFTCPKGTKRVATGRGDDVTQWCEKRGVKHGPYHQAAFLVHMGEGSAFEYGQYDNDARVGLWAHSETYGANWLGAFDDSGAKHGLWIDGDHKEHKTLVYVHGVAQGRTTTEYEGHLAFVGSYLDGKLHGPAMKLQDMGVGLYVEAAGDYAYGERHGRWISWSDAKTVSTDQTYERGKPSGRWREYLDGQLFSDATYDAGTLHGERVTYGLGGRTSVGHYDHGARHGVFTYWFDGKQLATTTMDHDTGDWIAYEGSVLVERGRLVNNAREGAWAFLDSSDNPARWAEGGYVAGKRVGPWVFSMGATRLESGSYAADQRTGEWTIWNDGKPAARGPYVAGQRHGAWTYWREDGTVKAQGEFAAGKQAKTWQLFDAAGVQTLTFRAGQLLTVDGKKATKRWVAGAVMVDWERGPERIVEGDPIELHP